MSISTHRGQTAALVAALLVLVASCVDAPSAPEGMAATPGPFVIAPVFSLVGPGGGTVTPAQASALGDAFDRVDHFRMIVTKAGGAVVLDTIIEVTPGSDEYDLQVDVSAVAGESFLVTLIALEGTTELFKAESIPVTAATPGAPGAAPPPAANIPLTYTGPGATAVSVEVAPGQVVLGAGGTAQMGAKVLDDQGAVIAGALVSWSSTAEGVATISASGVVTGAGDGIAEVVATSPTGLTARAWVYVVSGALAYVQGGKVMVRAPAGGEAQAKTSGSGAQGPTWAGDDLYYSEGGSVQKAGSATTLLSGAWPSVSPDGGKIAADGGGSLVFANIDGTNDTEGPSGSAPIWTDWSTLVVGGGSIQQVQADGTSRTTLVSGDAELPAFSNGGTLAYVSGGKLRVQGRADALADAGGRPSWSPDGAWIVVPGGGGLLLVPTGGSAPPVVLPGLEGATDPAWQGTSVGGGSPPGLDLTRLDPDPAIPGQEVSIVGSGFDWIIPANNKVFWPGPDGALTGEVLAVTATSIRSVLPRNVIAGQIRVENRQGTDLLEYVPRLGSLEVHARTPWDAPVGGVGVVLVDRSGSERARGTTDSDGGFVATGIPPESYVLTLRPAAGYELLGESERSVEIGATTLKVEATLRPAVQSVEISPEQPTVGVGEQTSVSVAAFDIASRRIESFASTFWASRSSGMAVGGTGLQGVLAGVSPSSVRGDAKFVVSLGQQSYEFGATVTSYIEGRLYQSAPSPVDGPAPTDATPAGGITVELLDGSGTPIATTSTDGRGYYRFSGLLAADHTVRPQAPTGSTVFSPTQTTVTLGASHPTGEADFTLLERDSGGVASDFRVLLLSGGHTDNNAYVTAQLAPIMPDVTFESYFLGYGEMPAPTLAYLATFDVVLLYENGSFGGTDVGNVVAQYVGLGGNVVIGTFYWQDSWGAFGALEPFVSGGSEYSAGSLDPSSLVAHPLTEGVTAVSANSYGGGGLDRTGTTVLARWLSGRPLIGYRTESGGQRIVGVNLFVAHGYYGGISGDFYQIWDNALRWAAAGSTPVAPAPGPPGFRVAPKTPDPDAIDPRLRKTGTRGGGGGGGR